jgi:hypothetical protein
MPHPETGKFQVKHEKIYFQMRKLSKKQGRSRLGDGTVCLSNGNFSEKGRIFSR